MLIMPVTAIDFLTKSLLPLIPIATVSYCLDASVHDDRAQVYTHIPRYPRLFLTIRRRSTKLLLWRQRQHLKCSQHFSMALPVFLVITSVSHISLPQILQQILSLLRQTSPVLHLLS